MFFMTTFHSENLIVTRTVNDKREVLHHLFAGNSAGGGGATLMLTTEELENLCEVIAKYMHEFMDYPGKESSPGAPTATVDAGAVV